jgi:hypothetical protein
MYIIRGEGIMSAVNVYWHDPEKTIIVQEFPDVWTWEDFWDCVNRTVAMEHEIEHEFYVVGVMSPKGKIPPGNSFEQFSKALQSHRLQMRLYITATGSVFANIMFRTYLKVVRMDKFTSVVTLPAAINLIETTKKKNRV